MLHKFKGLVGDSEAKALNCLYICGKQGDWLLRLAPLDRIEPVNGLREIGMGGKAVDRVGRNHRDAARKQNLCGGLKPLFIALYYLHLEYNHEIHKIHEKKFYTIYMFYTAKSFSSSRAASFTSSTHGRFL